MSQQIGNKRFLGIGDWQGLFLLPLLLVFACFSLIAQTSMDSPDEAKRPRAMALFSEGKRLEALPLLEELAQRDPKDSEVLVALAASLVEHAATLTDPDTAAKERFRARDLLQQAWGLGNATPVEENLRQLLAELPANGTMKFSDNLAAEQAMNRGEAAFARRDFDQALKEYAKALALDPTNYSAALFTANAYDKKNELDKASEWYERTIQLDPDVETAYRYYADMLAKQGDMVRARSMLIHAAVAEPYNKIVWREIRAWATINKTAFNLVYVTIPFLPNGDAAGAGKGSADLSAAWRTYYSVKAEWKQGGRSERQFPQETGYRHSLAEESDALTAAAQVLEKLKADTATVELVQSNPPASLLLKLYETGLLDAYVLFSLGDEGIAKDYIAYRTANRAKLEDYMDKFVIPPAPARH